MKQAPTSLAKRLSLSTTLSTMALTLAAFTRTLDRDESADCTAGIVLQAYLPDAYLQQQALTQVDAWMHSTQL